MYFDSFRYIFLFLPSVLVMCRAARLLPVPKAPQAVVLLASLLFYSWQKPKNLIYLLGSIAVNWWLARLIAGAKPENRKFLLQLSLTVNIGFLFTFKYINFLIANVPYFSGHHLYIPDLGYPLGISFFTLAQVMYLVDCYEELIAPSSLFDHSTFVAFFPYVISGPISRAKRILHQFPALNGPNGPGAETLARAMFLFSLGLIKKVVFADAFAKAVNYGFSNIVSLSALESWCIVSAYALQLYFDFSGYSDMAIASALFLGIDVPRNFDAPLRSLSIIDFWQRWHISLSSFITTYLYTPILRSFNHATLATASLATLLAMTIAGLWHGPAWTFVIFGVIHGIGLAINQYWKKKKVWRLPKGVCWLLTFALVDLAFVFFRSPDMATAELLLSKLFDWHRALSLSALRLMDGQSVAAALSLLAQVGGIVSAFVGKSSEQLAREFRPGLLTYAATVACLLIAFVYLNSNVAAPFVYFGF